MLLIRKGELYVEEIKIASYLERYNLIGRIVTHTYLLECFVLYRSPTTGLEMTVQLSLFNNENELKSTLDLKLSGQNHLRFVINKKC